MSRKSEFMKSSKTIVSTDSSEGEDEQRSRSQSKTRFEEHDDADSSSTLPKKTKKQKKQDKQDKGKKKSKNKEGNASTASLVVGSASQTSHPPQDVVMKEVAVICEHVEEPVRTIKKEFPDHQLASPVGEDMPSEPRADDTTKSSKKRKASSPVPEDDSSLQKINKITEAVRGIVLNEKNKVTKWLAEMILENCSKYEKVMYKMAAENLWLRGKLEAAESNKEVINETCNKLCAEVGSIKESLRQQPFNPPMSNVGFESSPSGHIINRTSPQGAPRSYALIVRGDKETLTTDEIKRRMAEGVKDVNVRVRSVRPIRSGGVVVETASGQERELLAKHQSFSEAGLRVVEPRKFNPRVILYDVPNEIKDDQLISGIREKNFADLPGAQVLQSIKVIKRLERKDKRSSNVVLELPPACNRKILQDGRAFIDWTSYKVATWEYVPRCYKCLAYGHMAKDCDKEQLCWKCCNPGHLAVTCTAPEACGNCRARKWPSNHAVTSSDCPLYLARLQWLRSRIAQTDNE